MGYTVLADYDRAFASSGYTIPPPNRHDQAHLEISWKVYRAKRGDRIIIEYVITFSGANHAVKAEHLLLLSGLNPSVMPVVPQIAEGCGIALRIKPHELALCREVLDATDIYPYAVYERSRADHSYVYAKI